MGGDGIGTEVEGMLGIGAGIGIEAPGNPPGGPDGDLYWATAPPADNAPATRHIAITLNRDMVVLPNSRAH
jgi:hypothetical protein